MGESKTHLSNAALVRTVTLATLIAGAFCAVLFCIELANGATALVLWARAAMVLCALSAALALRVLPSRETWTIVQVLAVAQTALLSVLALLDPDTELIRVAGLAAPPAIAAAIAPNNRRLPIVLGLIGGTAGSMYLAQHEHGASTVVRWIILISMVTALSYFGAARYLRVWEELQSSIRRLTLALSEAAADLITLRDEHEIIERSLRVLHSQQLTASFLPAVPEADASAERKARLSRNELEVPVLVEERPFGLLRIEGESLNEASAGALELFARHVGVAIANVRNHRRAQARLEELRAVQRELIERERLAVLGEAAAVVSHEVRNPLGAILNATALLKRTVRDAPAQDLLRMVEEECTRLDSLVHDLLFLARPLEPKVAPLDLAELCDRVVQCVRQQPVFAAVTVDLRAEEGLPAVHADSGHIQIAIENLLRNAAQASPPNSRIFLSLRRLDDAVRLTVEDEGSGIPDDDLKKIFRPFFTTRVTGTGLGLSLVKRIAEAHGAAVQVSRRPDRGSRFELELRIASKKLLAPAA